MNWRIDLLQLKHAYKDLESEVNAKSSCIAWLYFKWIIVIVVMKMLVKLGVVMTTVITKIDTSSQPSVRNEGPRLSNFCHIFASESTQTWKIIGHTTKSLQYRLVLLSIGLAYVLKKVMSIAKQIIQHELFLALECCSNTPDEHRMDI